MKRKTVEMVRRWRAEDKIDRKKRKKEYNRKIRHAKIEENMTRNIVRKQSRLKWQNMN